MYKPIPQVIYGGGGGGRLGGRGEIIIVINLIILTCSVFPAKKLKQTGSGQ